MDTPVKIAYFTSNTSDVIPLVSAVSSVVAEKGRIIDLCLRTRDDINNEASLAEFIEFSQQADIIMMHFMGGRKSFPDFDRFMDSLKDSGIPLFFAGTAADKGPELPGISTIDETDYAEITQYIHYSGIKNFRNMLLLLVNRFGGGNHGIDEPESPCWQGIYHPDFDGYPTLEEYLEKQYVPGKPTVGLWFYQSLLQSGNTEYVEALIREIERQGANVIPVFLYSIRDTDLGSEGTALVLREYFMKDGKPFIDVLVSPLMFSLSMWIARGSDGNEIVPAEDNGILAGLGVPVIKAILTQNTYDEWIESPQGLTPRDVTMSVAMPEFDGMLITVPVSCRTYTERDPLTGTKVARYAPIPERIAKTVRLSLNWAKLRYIPNEDKKVAIIFHNYPPRNDKIGNAFGLDSPVSVWNIMRDMQQAGYNLEYLPESGQTLIEDIIRMATNDMRWTSSEEMASRAAAMVPGDLYTTWFAELPEDVRKKLTTAWGNPPGEPFNHNNSLIIPGLLNGNFFIGLQPPRGFGENAAAVYHSPDHPPTHHYYAYYRWLRDVFKANVIMHIGKHGSLEWLPGKAAGLSESCFPDIMISDIPNIYPYIINNPGEGTQAKRRSYACIIDHLVPVMHNADTYEEMAELEVLLNDYYQATVEDRAKLPNVRKLIWEKTLEGKLDHDLAIDEATAFADFDDFTEKLHSYIHEMKDTQVRDGLHTFGEPPEGERLDEFIVAMTRLRNGDIPSIRKSLAEMKGFDYDDLLENRGKVNGEGLSNARIIESLHELSRSLVGKLHEAGFSENAISTIMKNVLGQEDEAIKAILSYICGTLVPKIEATRNELENTLDAAAGSFVPPGPSGAPTRGMADILPTGRNFYSVDPQAIPSTAAWEAGKALGDALLERYKTDEGSYPENIGMVVWGSATMRTKGDDVAEILYLMGVKPVWEPASGRVKGIELMTPEELNGRPRMDVTVRISGLFRDAFPNIVHLLDDAVQMVAGLDESPEINYLAAHVVQEIREKTEAGIDKDRAEEESRYRIFGCKPGAYGAGVSDLITTKNWETDDDLGRVYLTWGGYAYGKKNYGVTVPEQFKTRLSRLDLTVKNEDNREHDMLDSDDFYSYHGGMIAAVRAFKGKNPRAYAGDSSDPDRMKIRSTEEETKHIFRARILNPKWIESMKRHGYKGAADFSAAVDNSFGWDASAQVLEDWMYEELAGKYALDEEMQKWLKEVNPYALQNITERLLEAIQRGMWQATDEMTDELKNIYLDIEGTMEEGMSPGR